MIEYIKLWLAKELVSIAIPLAMIIIPAIIVGAMALYEKIFE